jgi:hypothetical protein
VAQCLFPCIERRYLSGVDVLIYNSATTRREAEHLIGRALDPEPPTLVAYPGCDHLNPQISEQQLMNRTEKDPLSQLFVGNVISRKELHIVLKALERLSDVNWTLTVIGNPVAHPSYARAASRQIEWPGLAERAQFAVCSPTANCRSI